MESLPRLCRALLAEQKETWPDLQEGYKRLKGIMVRKIVCQGFSILIQHNPGRIRSTLADVREEHVSERPCFLCPENLPEAQKGILYDGEFFILCNPMPVLSGHLTVAHLSHRPQAISEHMAVFLQLIRDFGSSWSILYNGPKCGASAPDHLHFQAIPRGNLPIEKESLDPMKNVLVTRIDGIELSRALGLGRELIILEGDDEMAMTGTFRNLSDALRKTLRSTDEPMMNIIGSYKGGKWRLLLFPRAKHRPDAFFEEENSRITVSPAVIEMGGILVTPMKRDFQGLEACTAESIYGEVSLDSKTLQNVIEAIASQ